MSAMQPVFLYLNSLEGFDWAAFWIAAFTATMMAGFFVDYIMQRMAFGPYINSLMVLAGVFGGLYLRFNYLQPHKLKVYDPYLSIFSCLGVVAVLLVFMALIRNRTS